MTHEEIRLLKRIHSLALNIEMATTLVVSEGNQAATLSEQSLKDLAEISALLSQFQISDSPELRRLADIPDHLNPAMTLKHFLNFMLPIERILDRNLTDDQFLISSLDQDRHVQQQPTRPLYFVLDNLRSAFNVGSIFRLADCVGASKLYLCGYTPGIDNKALNKTSLSTAQAVSHQHYQHVEEALSDLRQQQVKLIALETAAHATNLFTTDLQGPLAFVVGNERFGLDRKTLLKCDGVCQLPMFGFKNSLNVANALAVSAYEWSRQNS